jgi:hypothetical protein
MFQFVDKQFITDMTNVSGAIVIDADTQGAWEWGDHKYMRLAFPRAYSVYRTCCRAGFAKQGNCIVVDDSGYKIVILFTKRHRNDSKEIVIKNFASALKQMINRVSSDIFIYSSILGRDDHCFDEMIPAIKSITNTIDNTVGYNWFVYNKKGE